MITDKQVIKLITNGRTVDMTDRERDVELAKSLVGKTGDYFRPIWSNFASGYGWDGAWCSEAACCISFMAGNIEKIHVSNYAYGLVQKFRGAGRFGTSPALGAFIWFDYHDGAGPSHTGRVTGIDMNYVYTIEGNINGKVVSRRYERNNGYIYGYGYPLYEDREMRFGIDISVAQGNFNLSNAVDNHGVEFAIIKAGENSGTEMFLDPQFKNNYQKAKAIGLPIGAYWYSVATNKAEALAEADWLAGQLNGMQFELPIYIDVEDVRQAGLSATQMQAVVQTWLDRMYSAKWYAGVYTSLSWFQYFLKNDKIGKYPLWIAYWSNHKPTYSYDYGMWQSGTQVINGAAVDVDWLYGDYTSTIKDGGYNGYGKSEPTSRFSDVPTDASYYKAVEWAADNKIAAGYSDGTFRPDNDCTRAQFITMIWRMNGKPDASKYTEFKDAALFGNSAKAIQWAASEGIVQGYNSGYFGPNDTLTRAQAAIILWRWAGKPAHNTADTFSDVSRKLISYKAIEWGAENGIIKGYSDGTFRPNENCLRKHAVTFLYRAAKNLMK